ncbi:MAG: BT_3928 family protein [Sphingobacteriaceae bacterium]
MKKISINFSRLFVGLLFIFSGLIKANDPLGFGYKLEEYLEVFHLSFLNDYATEMAIFLCGLEVILGAALLLGIWSKKVIWGLLGLIVFFTFLTFYSAYFKVVTSCGCFGDAIPLTPWQSFGKDLILLAFILILFIYRSEIHPFTKNKTLQNVALVFITLMGFGFGVYTYRNAPFIDFLPYKVGANIPQLMKAPPGAPQDEYQIIYGLKNKKTGAQQQMTDKEYLKQEIWKDANWEIVGEPERKLIKKGYEIKIKDLKITDALGEDYTQFLLENPNYKLFIVAYNLSHTQESALKNLNELATRLGYEYGIATVLLTSSSAVDALKISQKLGLDMPFFYADAVPLKSMVRANPGVLLMKNGVVINKWHYRNVPAFEDLGEQYFKNQK